MDAEGDLAVRGAQAQGGGDVIDGLGHHPRPVDGVDGGEIDPAAEGGVGEHGLHQPLAVVEGAFDGDAVDVGGRCRRHLPALHLGYAALGKEDEDLHGGAPATAGDGSRAGIARRSADDDDAAARPDQGAVEEAAQQLQGHVLEGEGGAVEELQQPAIVAGLHQRHDGTMVEGGIAFLGHGLELVLLHPGRDEGRHRPCRDAGIGKVSHGAQPVGIEMRPSLRQIEAAIGGQPGQQHLLEAQDRRPTARAEIPHGYARVR